MWNGTSCAAAAMFLQLTRLLWCFEVLSNTVFFGRKFHAPTSIHMQQCTTYQLGSITFCSSKSSFPKRNCYNSLKIWCHLLMIFDIWSAKNYHAFWGVVCKEDDPDLVFGLSNPLLFLSLFIMFKVLGSIGFEWWCLRCVHCCAPCLSQTPFRVFQMKQQFHPCNSIHGYLMAYTKKNNMNRKFLVCFIWGVIQDKH